MLEGLYWCEKKMLVLNKIKENWIKMWINIKTWPNKIRNENIWGNLRVVGTAGKNEKE